MIWNKWDKANVVVDVVLAVGIPESTHSLRHNLRFEIDLNIFLSTTPLEGVQTKKGWTGGHGNVMQEPYPHHKLITIFF